MAGQYSRKQFFRRVPNSQLADYFQIKGVDLGIDSSKLKEKDTDTLFDAFTDLSPELQATIDAEFRMSMQWPLRAVSLPCVMRLY